MAVADARRQEAAGRVVAWLRRNGAVAACALLIGAGLTLDASFADHRRGSGHRASQSQDDNNNNNDNGNGNGNGNGGNSGGNSSGANGGSSSSAGGNNSVSSLNAGNTNNGNVISSNPSHGIAFHNGGVEQGGSGAQPTFGLGFNNNGGSLSASIPLGGGRAHSHDRDQVGHPLYAAPFGHGNSGARGLSNAAAPTRALSYGETATPGGILSPGTPALTNRLINSVTSTLSNRFSDRLGHSLRMHSGEPGATTAGPGGVTAAPLAAPASSHTATATQTGTTAPTTSRSITPASRPPATVVNNRFAGIPGNVFEPRIFTVPLAGETRYVPNEIVVGMPAGTTPAQVAAIARRNGLTPVVGGEVASSGIMLQRWAIEDRRPVADVIHALQAEANVQTAQPNFRFALAQSAQAAGSAGWTETPANGFSVQYAPAKLHLPQAHRLSTGQGVIVAVIDTGIDKLHPELAGAIAESFDAIGSTEPPDGHGTAIAGAIASHGRLVGVAPGARVLAIRAFSTAGPDAEATTLTIVRSIEWAIAHGARIINMSFAGARDPLISRALAVARRKGIVLIAAAGNGGPNSPPLYPAADTNVIAVSATDMDDQLLDVANRGRQIALTAPGVDILLPAPGARYQMATGTSFAAAHVAGIVALMLARNPQLTPDLVRAELVSTAHDLGPKGRDDMFGAGLADAFRAVVAANGGGQTVASAGATVP